MSYSEMPVERNRRVPAAVAKHAPPSAGTRGADRAAASVMSLALSTHDVPLHHRREWLTEVIGRSFVRASISAPPGSDMHNELCMHSNGGDLQLGTIRSNALVVERRAGAPETQDAFFAVVSMSGSHVVEQDGRRISLQPGDVTIYDTTRQHSVTCGDGFSKIVLSIPRSYLRERAPFLERCMAMRVAGGKGLAAVAARAAESFVKEVNHFSGAEFGLVADQCGELLMAALAGGMHMEKSVPQGRWTTLRRVKDFIELRLGDPELDVGMIAAATGLSRRHVSNLFNDEGTSPMRYVWRRRLENCGRDLAARSWAGATVTDIAFRWGFSDAAHFSRAFKGAFGMSPSDWRKSVLENHVRPGG